MDNLKVLDGTVKEITRALLEEGEYYIPSINTEAVSRIDPSDYINGGFIIQFSNNSSPIGVTGQFSVNFEDGIIKFDLESKVNNFKVKGLVAINAFATNADETDLVLEGLIILLLKIYERYTI
jgi:hypothetical protein